MAEVSFISFSEDMQINPTLCYKQWKLEGHLFHIVIMHRDFLSSQEFDVLKWILSVTSQFIKPMTLHS